MARNAYPGKCLRCGKDVPAGAGHFQRLPGKGWLVRCRPCIGKGNKLVQQTDQKSQA